MKIYFAGAYTGLTKEQLRHIGIKNKLYSFASEGKLAAEWGASGLMLDSGAFGVFTQGITININELIAFIQKYKPEVAVQLDVIGDEARTWKNYEYMKQYVPDVLPVIPYQASDEHIERCKAANDYVMIGGLVPLTRQKPKLIAWLDYLYGKHELRNHKTHLLGITTRTILERYPAYSSDSSSALSVQRYPSDKKLVQVKQRTVNYRELYEYGIRDTLALEKHITKLWESRGITWN